LKNGAAVAISGIGQCVDWNGDVPEGMGIRFTELLEKAAIIPSTSRNLPLFSLMKSNYAYSRRGPDRVAEELASVLSTKATFEFNPLFLKVHANLKARQAAGCGEEMLRLRVYEKLQNLVQAGIVKRTGKEYKGVPAELASFMETTAGLNAKFASRRVGAKPVIAKPVAAKSTTAKATTAKAATTKAVAAKR
jgi:hypothetical protein